MWSKKTWAFVALAIAIGAVVFWSRTRPGPAPADATDAAAEVASPRSPAPGDGSAPRPGSAEAAAQFADIPRDLPHLLLPDAVSPVMVSEIEDVAIRRKVYSQTVPNVVSCIASQGIDHKTLPRGFRVRLVLGPGTEGFTQAKDIQFLGDEDAPPKLVACFRTAFRMTNYALPEGTRGIVTTPPLGGQPDPPPSSPGTPAAPPARVVP